MNNRINSGIFKAAEKGAVQPVAALLQVGQSLANVLGERATLMPWPESTLRSIVMICSGVNHFCFKYFSGNFCGKALTGNGCVFGGHVKIENLPTAAIDQGLKYQIYNRNNI